MLSPSTPRVSRSGYNYVECMRAPFSEDRGFNSRPGRSDSIE